MHIELGYGNTTQGVDVPDKNLLRMIHANPVNSPEDEYAEIKRALENPIGTERLGKIVEPGEKIAIVTSDITRPMPTHKVMPILLDELYDAGVSPEDITLVFALGSHRPHTEEEKRNLAGERAFSEIKCVDGDPSDYISFGVTKRGTPCDITRIVAEADRRICLANIEYHYFAGYSGGAKSIMPGVSTLAAIQSNHRMMVDERARAGNIKDNPIREDIEEAVSMIGVDFILNVVLDEEKRIIKAVAGEVTKAHREGCKALDMLYKVDIEEKGDIVIVSQGGAPKDLNLYQTQKALDNAKNAVKDGGTVILVGSCHEGMGSSVFEEWMTAAKEPDDLIKRVSEHFELGGHKAAAIAIVLKRADVYLVSEMDDEQVKSIFFTPFHDVQEAFNHAMEKYGDDAKVIVMPHGGSTLPEA